MGRAMHESYTLQILTRERLEEWRDFHRINASDFVRERPPEQLEQAAEDNKLVVLDDAEGRIRASCGVFEYGEGSYREVGAVRVLVNGFGLQTAMMAAVVYSDWVYDPPDTSWLAITAKKNNGSIISIERAQFVSTEVLEEARLAAMGMKVLDSGKRHFLFLKPIFL